MLSFDEEYRQLLSDNNFEEEIRKRCDLQKRLSSTPTFLFGASWIGDFIYDSLLSMKVNPTGFIDNYATECSPKGYGPIYRPSYVKEHYSDCIIILTLDKAKEEVTNQLISLGFNENQIINYRSVNIMDIEHFSPLLDGYRWAYGFFKDDLSKQIIIQRIGAYLFGNTIIQSSAPVYFEEDMLTFTENEVFVDGGFFIGDTSEEFIKKVKNKYKKIYAFEPDEFVIKKVSSNLSTAIETNKIEVIYKGLYDKNGFVKFVSTDRNFPSDGGTVLADDIGEYSDNLISISVTSIDEFFEDKTVDLQPTFIKMDIEGSEYNALIGAETTIKKYKPKLAISVYHKPDDIYKLTKLIYNYNPNYTFTLRHYSSYMWDTVLFAY